MSNKFREKNIKIRLHYCFDDMINIKNLDPSEIKKIKNHTKAFAFIAFRYVTIKGLSYIKVKSINPLYLILIKYMSALKITNGHKHLTLVPTDKIKDTLKSKKNHGTNQSLIRSITNNLDNSDKNYLKINLNLDNDLPLELVGISYIIIVIRSIFREAANTI